MLQRAFWKVFPPLEVKATTEEIIAFLSGYAGEYRRILEKNAIALANDAEKTIYSIRIEHMQPDHLALLLISNVTGQHLSMGNYHIYRGVLSDVGHEILAVFTRAVKTMAERGYHSPEEAEQDLAWVRKQIASAG